MILTKFPLQYFTPNNYTHNSMILETVFDAIPDIADYDKIGIHLSNDEEKFSDGLNVYPLDEFIARIVIDCVWIPE